MSDHLQRFLWAQENTIEQVCRELSAGRKTGHWIWFIFPQVAGLGRSATAQHYAIRSAEEAMTYLEEPTLGRRLRKCCALLLAHPDNSAEAILGSIDALKLRSSMTLFKAVSGEATFQQVLDRFYAGQPDPSTLDILASWGNQRVS